MENNISLPIAAPKSKVPLGEIVASSLCEWQVLCWNPEIYPQCGDLLVSNNTFALISNITTEPRAGMPLAQSYKKEPDRLRLEHPELFANLQTTLSCIPVATEKSGTMQYGALTRPAQLHAFVGQASTQEYELFFSNPIWLQIIYRSQNSALPIDEVALAALRQGIEHKALSLETITALCSTLAQIKNDDYNGLSFFLKRLQTFLPK